MTVTRELEFRVATDVATARAAVRALAARGGKYLLAEETADSIVLRPRKGQDVHLSLRLSEAGSACAVHVVLTSPPHVKGDVFGGYRLVLGELRGELDALLRRGVPADAELEAAGDDADRRTVWQFAAGVPVLPTRGSGGAAKWARLALLVLVGLGILLSPAFVSHWPWFVAWAVAVTLAVAADRALSRR